jgi:hypothetical protein
MPKTTELYQGDKLHSRELVKAICNYSVVKLQTRCIKNQFRNYYKRLFRRQQTQRKKPTVSKNDWSCTREGTNSGALYCQHKVKCHIKITCLSYVLVTVGFVVF